jgi:hypothetical protein
MACSYVGYLQAPRVLLSGWSDRLGAVLHAGRTSLDERWKGGRRAAYPRPAGGLRRLLDKNPEAGRLILLVEDESVAPIVADAVGAMLALLHGRLGLHCTAVEIPCEWGGARGGLCRRRVEALLATRHVALERLSARSGAWVPDLVLAAVLEHMEALLAHGDGRNEGALAAVVFWRLSTEDYAFEDDDISEVLKNPAGGPQTPFERARAEQCFQNTYKGVEALLGGQPPTIPRPRTPPPRPRRQRRSLRPGCCFCLPSSLARRPVR